MASQFLQAQHPERLQLYSLATPNGQKVSIMLEEIGLPYEAHKVDISTGEQFTPEFLAKNPNNKIPAITDPNGPNNQPITLFESGAILIYLAEKSGQLFPQEPARRYETLQWVMFQMGGLGPMFGQFGFFHRYGGKEIDDPRPKERYLKESQRLLGVLNNHLNRKDWMLGDEYTIADIAIFPWISALITAYDAKDTLGLDQFPNVMRVLENFLARPAVERGMKVPA